MTQLLERALEAVQKLPPEQQDTVAAIILQELADEEHWNDAFAQSQPQLDRLAEKVELDIAFGRVQELGIDEL